MTKNASRSKGGKLESIEEAMQWRIEMASRAGIERGDDHKKTGLRNKGILENPRCRDSPTGGGAPFSKKGRDPRIPS